jgi:hypothetical protein
MLDSLFGVKLSIIGGDMKEKLYNGFTRLGILPYLLLGAALTGAGLYLAIYIVDNFWPIDVTNVPLLREVALEQADAVSLLRSAHAELIVAFLLSMAAAAAGLAMPVVYLFNRRFVKSGRVRFWSITRQSSWVGVWVAFCLWLQMNRIMGLAIALLVAAVFVIFEALLQLRRQAALEG